VVTKKTIKLQTRVIYFIGKVKYIKKIGLQSRNQFPCGRIADFVRVNKAVVSLLIQQPKLIKW
jgi:hypothetical protein